MFEETVVVEVPGCPALSTLVPVGLDDDDVAVAARVAPLFPAGTTIRLNAGSEWVVQRQEPVLVAKLRASRAELDLPQQRAVQSRPEAPTAGTPFRPKNRHRKSSGFRIKAIRGATVETDDGREIAFDELGRSYRQIAG